MSIDERGRAAGRTTVAAFEAAATTGLDYGELLERRRSQRRARTVTLAVVAVAALVISLAVRGVVRDEQHTQPAQPSPTRTLGLTVPLIAPGSVLDVRTMSFHIRPVPGFDPQGFGAGWSVDGIGQTVTLRWVEVADKITVTVLYQGFRPTVDPATWGPVEHVSINGADGHYGLHPGGPYDAIGGDFEAALVWEYAPGSWAYVTARSDRGDPGPQRLRSALIEVAKAVAPGGVPVRVPLRLGVSPMGLPGVDSVRAAGVQQGVLGPEAHLRFGDFDVVAARGTAGQFCAMYGDQVETFTYDGQAGCLTGGGTTDSPSPGTSFNYVMSMTLQKAGTVRSVYAHDPSQGFADQVREWQRVLSAVTVSRLDDESTWADLRTAVGD